MAAKGSHGLLLLAGDDLPQISQIYTEAAVGDGLPQIAQNSQKLLLGITSHRFHRFAQKLLILGGALVSSAPTKQTVLLPQIAQINTDSLGAEDSSGGILASAAAK